MIGLNCADINTSTPGAHVRCTGKGRKERAVPLTREAAAIVTVWLRERRGQPTDPAFPTRTGRRLSRDAIEHRLATHTAVATSRCPSLQGKKISPHVLRHTAAMDLLHAGVDTTVIALWLGHVDVRSTNARTRRSIDQGTRSCPDHPYSVATRPLPTDRPAARLP